MKSIDKWLLRMQECLNDCPNGHWLFAADGGLYLMKYNSDGARMLIEGGAMDPNAVVGKKLTGPEIDGGDW